MKFATKLSLGCIALLSCALGAAGLLLTGQSFSGSLASTRTALQAQQEKESTRWNASSFKPQTALSLKITFWRLLPSSMPSRQPMRAAAWHSGWTVHMRFTPACLRLCRAPR